MAMSPSPQLSPTIGGHRIDRTHSDTPPQPISKRDKKRTQLLDRLEELSHQFSSNKDVYYRQQLQAIQVDTHLILQSDPYRDIPIADLGEEVLELIRAGSGNSNSSLPGDIATAAGKIYAEFAAEVNDAMEERDAGMVKNQDIYERQLAELHSSNTFMIKLADEEHKALANTLRDRLINSVTGRKARLNKERENLEIGENNALLMHPNQYSIANPSSPGGVHSKRATRHRRDLEDLPGFPDSNKRKRRANDDAGSPAPARRLLENGFSTPIWTAEQIAKSSAKGESPLFSIDKLFTEKELMMTYNTSALAARKYVLSHKSANSNRSPPNEEAEASGEGEQNGEDADGDDDSPPSAPQMERQISHATRSTRGTGLGIGSFTTANGIDVLGDLSHPANFARITSHLPKFPPPLYMMLKTYNKDQANTPATTEADDVEADLEYMARCKAINREQPGATLDPDNTLGSRSLLTAACAIPGTYSTWMGQPKAEDESTNGRKKRTVQGPIDDSLGGLPMSKQNSGVGSEAGGVAMSRQGTGEGGVIGKRRGRN